MDRAPAPDGSQPGQTESPRIEKNNLPSNQKNNNRQKYTKSKNAAAYYSLFKKEQTAVGGPRIRFPVYTPAYYCYGYL